MTRPPARHRIGTAEADSAARRFWEAEADAYQAQHGRFLGQGTGSGVGFVWGPEGLTEQAAQLLGPAAALAGRVVLEVGCGAAQCSRWLGDRGARPVGVDIAVAQLRHARGAVPVVAASAAAMPLADDCVDLAFAAYGAVQFVADLDALLGEVSRVLRPSGRWVFSVTHPTRWAFPDDPGPAGLTARGSYFDRDPYVERSANGGPAVYAEFHRTVGDYVTALLSAGFAIDTIVEPEWPEWNDATWGGWSPLRGHHLPGTLIIGSRVATGQQPPRS